MSSNWKRSKLDNFILDSIVPDIDVPMLKPRKISKFSINRWIDNAKMKISENVQRESSQIADWILKTEIKKLKIPPKTKRLMELAMKSKYSDKPIEYKYSDDKLSEKRNTAFKNNVIIYKLKVLNHDDPLKQMISLKERKTFLLNKRLILLKGIKCNETLEVKFEKLGIEGKMIEKSFSFTSRPQVIMNKNEIESALESMRSDVEVRIDRFTMEGSGWSVIDLLNLADMMTATALPGRERLRSANSFRYETPKLKLKFGERAFSYAGPNAWNSLPSNLQEQMNTDIRNN